VQARRKVDSQTASDPQRSLGPSTGIHSAKSEMLRVIAAAAQIRIERGHTRTALAGDPLSFGARSLFATPKPVTMPHKLHKPDPSR